MPNPLTHNIMTKNILSCDTKKGPMTFSKGPMTFFKGPMTFPVVCDLMAEDLS